MQEAPKNTNKDKSLFQVDTYVPLKSRNISQETCNKFGYGAYKHGDKWVQVAPYFDEKRSLVAQKVRYPDKTFAVRGSLSGSPLFGANLWPDHGKRIVITEGEIDALSYAEITNCKWPVVSIPNGAQAAKKAIQANLQFLEGYEEVVIFFDDDEPGRRAAAECAVLFTPGKAKVASPSNGHKDLNDMLMAGLRNEMQVAVWNAKTYRPDGVINGEELWAEVSKKLEIGTTYPFAGLTRKLYGIRPQEIVTLCAGSGIGKSALTREIAYHLGTTLGMAGGYIGLEESVGRTALGIMGIHVSKPLHLPNNVDEETKYEAFQASSGNGNYHFYDHFGTINQDVLISNLRYMAKGLGCTWAVLDHISIVVSGSDDDNERKEIDRLMTRLRQLTQETGLSLFLVSHLKRPQGKGHEEGALTSLAQLRGSAAIAQLSDIVLGLERDQQGEEDQNITTVRILKNRYSGLTGVATQIEYDPYTGRLSEVGDEEPAF